MVGIRGTTQTRSFVYDSLKRLTSATNPESGATGYVYNENGNLTEKTDARTTKTTLVYDDLNRPTSKTYSGTTTEGTNAASATAPVYFKYDSQSLPSGAPSGFDRGKAVGRLAAVTYGSSTTSVGSYYGYDSLGRVLRRTQQIGSSSNNYAVQATYDLSGAMTGGTYPSSRTTSYSYDQAGRLSTFSGTLGDGTSRTYASVTQYNAAGQKERESFGTGTNGMTTPLYLKLHYNKRQQLVDLRLGSVNDEWNWNRGSQTFYYGSDAVAGWNPFADDDDNNGNVRRALHYVPTAVNGSGDVTTYVIPQLHDYSYDALNRISGMLEWQLDGSGNWQSNVVTQNYGYDRFGNRGITSATGGVNSYNPSYTASTNRISSLTYDSAGNITYDAANGGTMTYDAENHLVTASSGGTYVYDGEGKRVKRTASSQEWWYVYGIGGELIAEYLSTGTTTVKKEYGYRGGQLLVLWDADKSGDERLKWLVTDHLGSTRMEADKSGSLTGMRRHDYLPFGEEMTAGIRASGYGYASTNVRQKFTGQERDTETGLDFAQARYFSSTQGRFTSPDPLYYQTMMAIDPQRFNLYGYARNNPLKFVDPNGERIYVRGNLDFLRTEVLYGYAGGQEAFDQYFQITDGQVTLREGVDISKANAGVQELAGLVNATENYLFFAGNDGGAAADLFQGTRDAKGKLTNEGKGVSNSFTCGGNLISGCGTVVGTSGRENAKQPANLASGDPVFAVIAYNVATVQTQTATHFGNLNPVPDDVRTAQEAGVGQVVRPVRFFIHESLENREFSRQGVGNFNYGNAHAYAIRREAAISRELRMTGGFAGAFLNTTVPKK